MHVASIKSGHSQAKRRSDTTCDITHAAAALRDELNAIAELARETCQAILQDAERLMDSTGDDGMDSLMRIMTHCGFQDLIGQRLTKAKDALSKLEYQALSSAGGRGAKPSARLKQAEHAAEQRRIALLLHGPQRSGNAIAQDDIDALFNE